MGAFNKALILIYVSLLKFARPARINGGFVDPFTQGFYSKLMTIYHGDPFNFKEIPDCLGVMLTTRHVLTSATCFLEDRGLNDNPNLLSEEQFKSATGLRVGKVHIFVNFLRHFE